MKDFASSYNPEHTGFFRFKKLNGKYLLTNDAGDYIFLSENEFNQVISGKITEKSRKYADLFAGGVIRNAGNDEKESARDKKLSTHWLDKNFFLFSAPSLHIVVLTRRCNLSCVYCHAGASVAKGLDMTKETAEKVLEVIFQSPSQTLAIEFQGGEPLLNWPVLEYIVLESEKRAKQFSKNLILSVVTNLTAMTDEKMDFLIAHSVGICTSLDGPKGLHTANRPFAKSDGDTHSFVAKNLKVLREKVPSDKAANALLTVTKASLPKWKQIVDEYVRLKLKYICIRFLNPFGAAKKNWASIGYEPEEFLEYYKKSLDYILELNHSGKSNIIEKTALILLCKILGARDPGFLDLRSPCGAGIGQIAYNYDGTVYTCDEGRMLAAMGDISFCMGDAAKDSYIDMINSPVVKCMATASLTDLQPRCSSCVYKPYCGVCPVFNYFEHGDLFMYGANFRCRIYEGMLDYIFTLMSDKKNMKLFRKWTDEAEGK
ncbi:MAG: His-Xaa-Ser system radical SAM maturase HxsB [Elusimicrobiales bacterium]|nr:His-Xaa-Ser system radical SAM maturase HxsB [Elusimicrobiales bacterium]